MAQEEIDIRDALTELADPDEPLVTAQIYALSNLSRDAVALLHTTWPRIPLEKRQRMITTMAELAEDDIHADFTAVFSQALTDEDATVRADAIDGLWENESVSLIRPFLARLVEDTNDTVRARAASALGRFVLMGELGQLSPERTETILAALIALANTKSNTFEVRRRAVESLAYSSDDRVRPIIRRAYAEDNLKMRASAIFAMGRSADEGWQEIVRRELGNDNPELRYEAARAAGELEDNRATPQLVNLLNDQDLEVKLAAIWALGQIGGENAQRALQRLAAAPDTTLRDAAQEALSMLQFNAGRFNPASFAVADVPEETEAWAEEDDEEWDEDDEEWDEDDDEEWDEDDEVWEDDEEWDEEDDEWDEEDDETWEGEDEEQA